jgi:hypothetical protein
MAQTTIIGHDEQTGKHIALTFPSKRAAQRRLQQMRQARMYHACGYTLVDNPRYRKLQLV